MIKTAVSIIVGTLLGIIGARYVFVGSWLSLVPWGIVGLAIGYWGNRRVALTNGAAYGFMLAFAFHGCRLRGNSLPAQPAAILCVAGPVRGDLRIHPGVAGLPAQGRHS